jgi:TolB-like protein/Tfp pilus assembly protein PilF
LLAAEMHRASARGGGPFLSVNCAALPETLAEAELFGFERGAFTDARQPKPGLFQAAHAGTLFLDEIGCLSLPLQAKLLTAIEERIVRPLGSTRTEAVDVWIVAATSEDLGAMVRERRFREDLYYRLSTVVLDMPPLRERGDDVLLLAERFLAEACQRYDLPPKRLTQGARAALLARAWPGNVRELANAIERATLLGDSVEVTAPQLDLELSAGGQTPPAPEPTRVGLRHTLEEFERAKLEAALAAAGSVSRAAVLLGMPRNTLRYRLQKLGLLAGGPATTRPAPAPDASAPEPPAGPEDATATAVATPAGPEGARAAAPAPGPTRLLAFLAFHLLPSPAVTLAGNPLAAVMEKVQAFGGLLQEVTATSIAALFGTTAEQSAVDQALHTALAVLKAAAPGSRVPVGAILHAAEGVLEDAAGLPRLGDEARGAVLATLGDLARGVQRGAVLVSGATAPLLANPLGLWEEVSGGWAESSGPLKGSVLIQPVSRRPSIAVMPFADVGAAVGQDHFTRGLMAEVIGALSRYRWLSVVSRESTLPYRERAVDSRVAGAELGARYLLTGTVQTAGDRVRVRTELVDTEAGSVLWSESHEGPAGDLLTVQDRICARIVATMAVRVHQAEIDRALRKRPDSLDAFECVLRFQSLVHRFTEAEFRQAGELLERAIGLDPHYAAARAWRAWWCLLRVYQGWSTNPDADILEAGRMAEAALDLDTEDATALAIGGHAAAVVLHDYDAAVAHFDRSLTLNPSSAFAWGLSAATFCYIGEPRVALQRAEHALYLNPFDPFAFYSTCAAGFALTLLGQYEEALPWLNRARALNPRFSAALRVLAACLAHLGRVDQARRVAHEFRAIERNFSLDDFRQRYALRDPAALEAHVDDLRRAGLADES